MKIKRLGVSVELLKMVMAQDNIIPACKVTAEGIPADAVVCGASVQDGRMIWLTIQSDSFDEVRGDEIPVFAPTFERLQPRSAGAA